MGWRVFSFRGQDVWNEIDFTAKVELLDQVQRGKYVRTSHTHTHIDKETQSLKEV